MGGAYSHQGLPGAGDLLPSCHHGDHQRTSYSCKGTHSRDFCCSYSLSRHREQVVFSDALMTNKMSTNPLNSFSFDFMKSSDGLHDLHGEEGDLLLLARMGDSLHLPSESWLQYCNHLSEKHHAAAFQQFQQLLRNHLNQSHINKFT